MNDIILQPLLPQLTVTLIEDEATLKTIIADLRDNPGVYLGLPFNPYPRGIRVRQARAYVSSDRSVEEDVHIAKVGDCLVTSTNGFKAFTSDMNIVDGNLSGLPSKLFTPNLATILV